MAGMPLFGHVLLIDANNASVFSPWFVLPLPEAAAGQALHCYVNWIAKHLSGFALCGLGGMPIYAVCNIASIGSL